MLPLSGEDMSRAVAIHTGVTQSLQPPFLEKVVYSKLLKQVKWQAPTYWVLPLGRSQYPGVVTEGFAPSYLWSPQTYLLTQFPLISGGCPWTLALGA